MKIKVSELIENQLDYAVAICEGQDITLWRTAYGIDLPEALRYTQYWNLAGPIIEREGISIDKEGVDWSAYFLHRLFEEDGTDYFSKGQSPLIASMRCYIASKLGDEVEIPKELL